MLAECKRHLTLPARAVWRHVWFRLGEDSVPHTDKIDALIATVRDLNHTLRPKITNEAGGGSGVSAQAHPVLGEMRETELEAVLKIQAMLVGELARRDETYRIPIEEIGTRSLLSEFGTAREATLASLRELSDEQWAETHEITGGSASIADVVDGLIASDQQCMAKLTQLTVS